MHRLPIVTKGWKAWEKKRDTRSTRNARHDNPVAMLAVRSVKAPILHTHKPELLLQAQFCCTLSQNTTTPTTMSRRKNATSTEKATLSQETTAHLHVAFALGHQRHNLVPIGQRRHRHHVLVVKAHATTTVTNGLEAHEKTEPIRESRQR